VRRAVVLADVRLDLDDPGDPRRSVAVVADETSAQQASAGLDRRTGEQLPQTFGQRDLTGT
jgi:hypothetical protein